MQCKNNQQSYTKNKNRAINYLFAFSFSDFKHFQFLQFDICTHIPVSYKKIQVFLPN